MCLKQSITSWTHLQVKHCLRDDGYPNTYGMISWRKKIQAAERLEENNQRLMGTGEREGGNQGGAVSSWCGRRHFSWPRKTGGLRGGEEREKRAKVTWAGNTPETVRHWTSTFWLNWLPNHNSYEQATGSQKPLFLYLKMDISLTSCGCADLNKECLKVLDTMSST